MELRVNEVVIPERISFNYEELKQGIQEKMHDYEMIVYTDDQIKEAKADKASLNKLKKSLNDERIRREKEYMMPFNEFKSKVNELISIIEKPITLIDQRVKEFEEKQKEEKKAEIVKYMDQYKLPYGIDLRMIFSPKWLNSTVTLKSIYQEIDQRVSDIQADVDALEDLDDYQAFALTHYKETLDLRDTLNQVKVQKDYKAKLERIEAERKEKEHATKPAAELPFTPDTSDVTVDVPAEPEKPAGQWIMFVAYLTVSQAEELKYFFVRRGIDYKPISKE